MRYWKRGTRTLAKSADNMDFAAVAPTEGWVELADEAAYNAEAAATNAALPSIPQPITTSLTGNALSHNTDPGAKRVTVYVIAPTSGPQRARPTIDGTPVLAGGAPFVYQEPRHSISIVTRAGSNDVTIVEEF
jgi:hypothetical protein